jgi:PAS domain-containing protein
MADTKAIERAKEHFSKILEEQLKRIEAMKEDQGWTDYASLDTIIIGICWGDGIGPYISRSARMVLESLLADEIKKGKVELRDIEGLTIENRVKAMKAIPDDVLAELKKCHVILKGPTTTPKKGDPWPNIESANVAMRRELDEIVLPKDNMIANVNQNMKKNGERAWVAWTNRLMDMGDGRKEVLCTGVDITGHHRMEPPDESSALPQGVLDSIPVATLVISQDGTVQACNGQFMDMWELPDGCHGMPLSDLLDLRLPKLEDRDGARSRLSRLAAGDSDEERFDMTLKNGTKVKFVAGTSWLNDRSAVRAWSFLEQTDPVGAGEDLFPLLQRLLGPAALR